MSLRSKPELVKMAVEIATVFGLDPALVCSHIDCRTRWDSGYCVSNAVSYLAHQQFPDPMEREHRAVQWGLMAISGEFARQEGYHEASLTLLLQPRINLCEGCRL